MEANARTNKTVSFAHYDKYELELLTYALDPARGKFGPYIKRLIERDRDGVAELPAVVPRAVPVAVVAAGKASVAHYL